MAEQGIDMIAETLTFDLGHFTVWQRPRFDNPAWPVYIVYLRDRLVGKSFSRPDLSCCEWLAKQKTLEPVYADTSAPLWKAELRGVTKARKRK